MCFFFEYANCGHKYHVPYDTDKCPPEGFTEKDETTKIWAGGCPLRIDKNGTIQEPLPEGCFLLGDPGLGFHDCPRCELGEKRNDTRGMGHTFRREKCIREFQARLRFEAQAEDNLEMLIKYGEKPFSEWAKNFQWDTVGEWIQPGITMNPYNIPLPANYKERLGKPYVSPPEPQFQKPSKVTPTHELGSIYNQYTHSSFDLYHRPDPNTIRAIAPLRGSLPMYLLGHISSKNLYTINAPAPGADGRVHYDTSELVDPEAQPTAPIQTTAPNSSDRNRDGDDLYEQTFRSPDSAPAPQPLNPQVPSFNPHAAQFRPIALGYSPEQPPFTQAQTTAPPHTAYNYQQPQRFPAAPPAPTYPQQPSFPPTPPTGPRYPPQPSFSSAPPTAPLGPNTGTFIPNNVPNRNVNSGNWSGRINYRGGERGNFRGRGRGSGRGNNQGGQFRPGFNQQGGQNGSQQGANQRGDNQQEDNQRGGNQQAIANAEPINKDAINNRGSQQQATHQEPTSQEPTSQEPTSQEGAQQENGKRRKGKGARWRDRGDRGKRGDKLG
jgi:hypothetical protein